MTINLIYYRCLPERLKWKDRKRSADLKRKARPAALRRGRHQSYTQLDIESKPRSVIYARGNTSVSFKCNMCNVPCYQGHLTGRKGRPQ